MKKFLLAFSLFSSVALAEVKLIPKRSVGFEEQACLKFRVDFWENVYTKWDVNQAIFYNPDTFYIYEVLDITTDRKELKAVKKEYKARNMNFRVQIGIKSRFEEGMLKYEGKLGKAIHNKIAAAGLPKELALLPHVESSYNEKAQSKVKASGLWQIMPKTAKQYGLKQVKKLKDPATSTDIAIKIFKSDYAKVQDWPLAVTGYNQGINAMINAKKQLGSDICLVIDQYDGKYFGHSGENFFASLLAVIRIVEKRGGYYGSLP